MPIDRSFRLSNWPCTRQDPVKTETTGHTVGKVELSSAYRSSTLAIFGEMINKALNEKKLCNLTIMHACCKNIKACTAYRGINLRRTKIINQKEDHSRDLSHYLRRKIYHAGRILVYASSHFLLSIIICDLQQCEMLQLN